MKNLSNFKNTSFWIILLILAGCTSTKQTTVNLEAAEEEESYYEEDHIRYQDYTYVDNIHSVILHKEGADMSMPFIRLGSNDKLTLSFDDLDSDIKSYRYEILHCDANWKPSELSKYRYSDGYETALIDDYEYSFNTMEDFTHYRLVFPREGEAVPIVSGNFIIKVFVTGQRDRPVLTRRFMVFEPKVDIEAEVQPATPVDKRQTHQEVDFTVELGDYYVADPHQNIKVMVLQNKRWDKIIKNIKPRFINPNELDYEYMGKIIFSGLNEFRFFDTRSLQHQVRGIKELYYDSLGNHVVLEPDVSRAHQNYLHYEDLNGNYFIISYDNARRQALEADYAHVHFSLHVPPMSGGNVYLMGELNDWQFRKRSKMVYNYDKQAYETTMYLKQGYYNYHYVFLPNNADRADASVFEGEHFETENDYTIFVYHRPSGEVYDKLIGVARVSSLKHQEKDKKPTRPLPQR